MMDMSGMMVFMVLGWVILIAAIIAGVWWLVSRCRTMTRRESPLAFLRERYARGEISKEEYESRRRDLAA